DTGSDKKMVDHLRFTRDLIRLRWNHAALRSDNVNPFHVHNENRVIAFHRWLDSGDDVIVAATLSDTTWYNYAIGFPYPDHWTEVFNSDVYENWVNPSVAGNGGGIAAWGTLCTDSERRRTSSFQQMASLSSRAADLRWRQWIIMAPKRSVLWHPSRRRPRREVSAPRAAAAPAA